MNGAIPSLPFKPLCSVQEQRYLLTFKINKYFLFRLQLALSFLKGHYLFSLLVCNGRLLVVPSHVCLFLSDVPITGSCILTFYLLLRTEYTPRHLYIALLSAHNLINFKIFISRNFYMLCITLLNTFYCFKLHIFYTQS